MVVNPQYLDKENLAQIQSLFKQNKELPSIHLHSFFELNFYGKILEEISSLSFKKEKDPLTHSYSAANIPRLLSSFFSSSEFKDFLFSVGGKRLSVIGGRLFSFSWKEYTVLHDTNVDKPGYDLIIDCTDDWDDSFGGSLIYVPGTGEYTSIPYRGNSLTIVQRKKGVQKFIKYVNTHAGKKKRIFFLGNLK